MSTLFRLFLSKEMIKLCVCMQILPKTVFAQLAHRYHQRVGIGVLAFLPDGRRQAPVGRTGMLDLPLFRHARAYLLREALRWGEAYTALPAPSLLFWVVPVVDGETLRGGLCVDPVWIGQSEDDRMTTVNHLVMHGATHDGAAVFLARTVRLDQAALNAAPARLYEALYTCCGLHPALLIRNRENALQQRRISEYIQERKHLSSAAATPLSRERLLLSLIRAGDRNGARGLLNDMLAAQFLNTPRLAIIKARMIELTGSLVRGAIEDTPALESMLTRQQGWMNALIEAADFVELCEIVRIALDDFIDCVAHSGYTRQNRHVTRALNYINTHFARRLTLDEIAAASGISRSRLGHLVKDTTGLPLFEHLKRARVAQARRLLVTTDLSCAEVAYQLGFADQNAFIRHYRELTGLTPGRMRRRHGPGRSL